MSRRRHPIDPTTAVADADHRLALDCLGTYLINRADRGPVAG
jgi:hypothetical protein